MRRKRDVKCTGGLRKKGSVDANAELKKNNTHDASSSFDLVKRAEECRVEGRSDECETQGRRKTGSVRKNG